MSGEVNQSGDNAAVERLIVRRTRQLIAVIKGNCDCTAIGIGVDGSRTQDGMKWRPFQLLTEPCERDATILLHASSAASGSLPVWRGLQRSSRPRRAYAPSHWQLAGSHRLQQRIPACRISIDRHHPDV